MAIFENPAAAISACRRQGRRGSHALYICALARRPDATPKWAGVARRLAAEGGLSGSRRRARRTQAELVGDLRDEWRTASANSEYAKADRIMTKIKKITAKHPNLGNAAAAKKRRKRRKT